MKSIACPFAMILTLCTTPPAAKAADVPTPLLRKIHHKVHRVHHYQRLLGVPLRVYRWRPESHPHLRRFYLRWWTRKAHYWHEAWLHRPRVPHWSVDWDAIAACESGGRWRLVTTGNGFYFALQFVPSTWTANGGSAYYINAGVAPPKSVQIRVAENVLASEGIGAWPVCGAYG